MAKRKTQLNRSKRFSGKKWRSLMEEERGHFIVKGPKGEIRRETRDGLDFKRASAMKIEQKVFRKPNGQ